VCRFNRDALIVANEFFEIGETAIAQVRCQLLMGFEMGFLGSRFISQCVQWGFTDGSPVPGMGFDARRGNQPRGTRVVANLGHELGIFAKQNSFFFQAESFNTVLDGHERA
jgi:hypothetical protein